MIFETLTTERLLLKKLTPDLIDEIFENHPQEEIMKMLGLSTEEEFQRNKKKQQGGYVTYDRTIVHFKLVIKETGEVIGGAGFHNWYPDHKKAELGYALYKDDHRGKGYMSEAVSAILEYGFDIMGLNRIEASTGPGNAPSQSIIKKFGFTQEGYLRQHYIRDGEIQDSLIFSLLKEEYVKPENHI